MISWQLHKIRKWTSPYFGTVFRELAFNAKGSTLREDLSVEMLLAPNKLICGQLKTVLANLIKGIDL